MGFKKSILKRTYVIIVFSTLLLICLPAIASAQLTPGTYYVDIQNGTDDEFHGTSQGTGAFKTLHYALAMINSGDPGTYMLNVASGVYSVANGELDEELLVSHSDVTIVGAGREDTVIDGSSSTSAWMNWGLYVQGANAIIKELQVRSFFTAIFIEYADNPTVEGCKIFNNDTGIEMIDSTGIISKNELIDNDIGIYLIAGETGAYHPWIENNLIYDASEKMETAIIVHQESSGILSPGIYHNTIDGTTSDAISISGALAEVDIKFNIISNSGGYGIYNLSSNIGSIFIDYNDLWNNASGSHYNCASGISDIFEDPIYGSYALQPGSPCIDAIPFGSPPDDPVSEDYDGTPRPQGSGFDMGAYEFAASADYTLTVSISPAGGGSVTDDLGGIACPADCTEVYPSNTSLVLTAAPASGYRFLRWTGSIDSTDNPLSFALESDKTLTAVFGTSGNSPADTPTAVSPADGAIFDSGPVTLAASAFSDPEGDAHLKTYWRVRQADSVYYRSDYDESFSAEVEGSEGTQHLVAGLQAGMQYVWQVGYMDSGSGQISWSAEYTLTVGTLITDPSIDVPPGTDVKDYRMISFVLWPKDPSPKSVFGTADDLYRYRIGTYDPGKGAGGYMEYGSDFKVKPGRAYWILAKNGLIRTVEGILVTKAQEVEVPLQFNSSAENGWNMIACPNESDYNWSDVEIIEYDVDGNIVFGPTAISQLDEANGYVDKRLWRWENGAYASDTTRMKGRSGYWVKVKKENVFLRFLPSHQLETAQSGFLSLVAEVVESAGRWLKQTSAPNAAVADAGDSPPLPPEGLGDDSADSESGGGGGCFIESAKR